MGDIFSEGNACAVRFQVSLRFFDAIELGRRRNRQDRDACAARNGARRGKNVERICKPNSVPSRVRIIHLSLAFPR
jgi:hypothetical protein